MTWISVENELPKPFEVVWIYWRDKEVLLGCRTYQDAEHYDCEVSEGWYSFDYEKGRWTNYWQRVSASNLDKPDPPNSQLPIW